MLEDKASNTPDTKELLNLTSQIVEAYVGKNAIPANDLPRLIKDIHSTLTSLGGSPPEETRKPVVPVRKSITDNYLVCLEDGKRLKMLKRYLRSRYGLSPEQYRARWGLPADYPMVAPNYSAKRSEFAKQIGLGKSTQERKRRRKA